MRLTGLSYKNKGRFFVPGIVLLALLLSGCSGGNGIVEQTDPTLNQLEKEMFQAINHHRASKGLPRLDWHDRLAAIARGHSHDMAAGTAGLGHSGAAERTKLVEESIEWKSISENVAYSTERDDLIDFLVRRWLESAGHRTNIEGTYNLTGIGAAESADGKVYFTQIFVLSE